MSKQVVLIAVGESHEHNGVALKKGDEITVTEVEAVVLVQHGFKLKEGK